MPVVYDKVNVYIKPDWLKIRLHTDERFASVAKIVQKHGLNTICDSGRCPNKAECWSRRTATFMVAGEVCTRACRFCATTTGKPLPIDPGEPERVARSIALMELKHAVITSVTRDDLDDGGAGHWFRAIEAVRGQNPSTTIEVLIPDMGGNEALLDIVLAARPDIVGHNIETVERLTPEVRSRASYERSLGVLRHVASRGFVAKSGLMVGLGETADEVLRSLDDLRKAGVGVVTIGQYLRPSREHMPVAEYVTPETFEFYRTEALARGFAHVASGPLVRSSYMAEAALGSLGRADKANMAVVELLDWGKVDYAEALERQRKLFVELIAEREDGARAVSANSELSVSTTRGAGRMERGVSGSATLPEQTERAAGDSGGSHLTASGQNTTEQQDTVSGGGQWRGPSHRERTKKTERAGWLVMCEHPHVYTLGKSGKSENLLVSEESLRRRGAALHRTERGGDVTYHGPGQLVCYPILDLGRTGLGLRKYIGALEESVIETLAEMGIEAGRVAGKTGVWVGETQRAGKDSGEGDVAESDTKREYRTGYGDMERGVSGSTTSPEQTERAEHATERQGTVAGAISPRGSKNGQAERKICAIGVKASRGVVMHGLALNVTTELGWFELINPCGMAGGAVTSIEAEIERAEQQDTASGWDSGEGHLTASGQNTTEQQDTASGGGQWREPSHRERTEAARAMSANSELSVSTTRGTGRMERGVSGSATPPSQTERAQHATELMEKVKRILCEKLEKNTNINIENHAYRKTMGYPRTG